MRKILLSGVAALAMSTFAIAGGDMEAVVEPVVEMPEVIVDDSGFYVGLAYSYFKFTNDTENVDVTSNAYTLLGGYQFNKYISLEARYMETVGDWSGDDDRMNDTDETEVSNFGVYLKPMYPIDDFSIYGLVGYGKQKWEYSTHDSSNSNFQFGLGANYSINNNLNVFIDWMRLYDGDDWADNPSDDFTMGLTTLGVTYKF